MANKEKIYRLSKYQMKVLYYKSKEGATHEEIAGKLGRDVKTVQSHMTNIYKILEISGPGKSKEEMDSELKNEICPIIRQMFSTFDDVKTWAPRINKTPDEEKEEPVPPYQPPPSLERVLKQAENKPSPPEVLEPPPPGRVHIRWMLAIIGLFIGLAILAGWRYFSSKNAPDPTPTETPTRPDLVQPSFPTDTAVFQTIPPTVTVTLTPIPPVIQTTTPTPTLMPTQISPIDRMVLLPVPAGEFKMGSSKADDAQALD
jgi:DNA-binding CsgD family transcriptional regulator